MENRNEHSTYVQELVDALTGDNISFIDFDGLRNWLRETSATLDEVVKLREDAELLRQDYIGRIAGMTKAIAAVSRCPDGWESALVYLETLPSLNANELIDHYRRTSARFRDTFPTSFGLLRNRQCGGGRKDARVYK